MVLGLRDGLFHLRNGVDQVEALTFHYLQGECGLAVEAGGAGAVFEGVIDLRQLTQGYDPVAIDLDWQAINVLCGFERRRNLDREGTLRGFNLTGCNQLVVVPNNVDQLICGDVVRLKPQRIDDNL